MYKVSNGNSSAPNTSSDALPINLPTQSPTPQLDLVLTQKLCRRGNSFITDSFGIIKTKPVFLKPTGITETHFGSYQFTQSIPDELSILQTGLSDSAIASPMVEVLPVIATVGVSVASIVQHLSLSQQIETLIHSVGDTQELLVYETRDLPNGHTLYRLGSGIRVMPELNFTEDGVNLLSLNSGNYNSVAAWYKSYIRQHPPRPEQFEQARRCLALANYMDHEFRTGVMDGTMSPKLFLFSAKLFNLIHYDCDAHFFETETSTEFLFRIALNVFETRNVTEADLHAMLMGKTHHHVLEGIATYPRNIQQQLVAYYNSP